MSLTPFINRPEPDAAKPVIVLPRTTALWVCRSDTPKVSPPTVIRLSLITTLSPVTSTVAVTEYPLKTTLLPSILTQPRESQCQPGPDDTCDGTAFNTAVAGTPVFDASG